MWQSPYGDCFLFLDSVTVCEARSKNVCVLVAKHERSEVLRLQVYQILPPQPVSATKKDIARKTRDFLGFSSFFSVFQALAEQVLLFSKF